jgi:hypothetical protein
MDFNKELDKKITIMNFLKLFDIKIPDDVFEQLALNKDIPDTRAKDKVIGKMTLEEAGVYLELVKMIKEEDGLMNKLQADVLRIQADLVEKDKKPETQQEVLDLVLNVLDVTKETKNSLGKNHKMRKFLNALLFTLIGERLDCFGKIVYPTRQADIIEEDDFLKTLLLNG